MNDVAYSLSIKETFTKPLHYNCPRMRDMHTMTFMNSLYSKVGAKP